MKGDPKIVGHLNTILRNELTAINQYFLHSRMLRDWGVSILAEYEYKESLDEMRHADTLIQRILFLDGLPNLQDLGRLMIGENVAEILDCDLRLEDAAIPDLRVAIADCESLADYETRHILREILSEEEEHVDFLETQKTLIENIGIERYILLQSKPAGS